LKATVLLSDERGAVGFSLVRWAIIIILLGLVVIEGGSIIFTTIGLQNAADAAALDAADTWKTSRNLPAARAAALMALDQRQQEDARVPAAEFEADGAPTYEVRFTVKKQASTLLVHRIGFLEGLAEVEVDTEARPVEAGV
jgi:uncharacterized membrane protein